MVFYLAAKRQGCGVHLSYLLLLCKWPISSSFHIVNVRALQARAQNGDYVFVRDCEPCISAALRFWLTQSTSFQINYYENGYSSRDQHQTRTIEPTSSGTRGLKIQQIQKPCASLPYPLYVLVKSELFQAFNNLTCIKICMTGKGSTRVSIQCRGLKTITN